MDISRKTEAYFAKERPFKSGLALLRELALKTELQETFKWSTPVYTIDGKNVLGITAFKGHFGVWFFNGVFLKDPKKVLVNAQEGKTKSMRHWKFTSVDQLNQREVLSYMEEAIENQKKGLVLNTQKRPKPKMKVPLLLASALKKNELAKRNFEALPPYKQNEYSEYITTAKQEKTKLSRLEKILPMIIEGIGFNDKYR
ncbi:MAG: YdeI/OmpD-associated family protein [Flavobacteriaceae bacterium]